MIAFIEQAAARSSDSATQVRPMNVEAIEHQNYSRREGECEKSEQSPARKTLLYHSKRLCGLNWPRLAI